MAYLALPFFTKQYLDTLGLDKTELGRILRKVVSSCEILRQHLEHYDLNLVAVDSAERESYLVSIRRSRESIQSLKVQYDAAVQNVQDKATAFQLKINYEHVGKELKKQELDKQQSYMNNKKETGWGSITSLQTAQRELTRLRDEYRLIENAIAGLEIEQKDFTTQLNILLNQRGFLLQLEGKWNEFLRRVKHTTDRFRAA